MKLLKFMLESTEPGIFLSMQDNTEWRIGEKNTISMWRRKFFSKPALCSNQVFHAYTLDATSAFCNDHYRDANYTHISSGRYGHPWVLCEMEGKIKVNDGGKVGCTKLTLIKTIISYKDIPHELLMPIIHYPFSIKNFTKFLSNYPQLKEYL